MDDPQRIAVIGLGYVGLPLAVAFARHWPVVGFDRDPKRVAELRAGRDRTGEVTDDALAAADRLRVTDTADEMAGADLFVIAVPTPVDAVQQPDLSAVRDACESVGGVIGKGAVVVLESTVYPGVTEDICGPAIATASGLVAGRDFKLGYSPERMNPGDPAHGLADLIKVVAGTDAEVAALLERVYGRVTGGRVFVARDIRTAEAAKVIENAQRDINIAFANECAMIFDRLGLRMADVLDAARTKWNFVDFRPGLVGGHCIGVDPYYLAAAARAADLDPRIVLAGRRLNDSMAAYVAERVLAQSPARPRVLVLGATFKENVPDLRNTQVVALIRALQAGGATVVVADPCADPVEARALYDIELAASINDLGGFDVIVGAVAHAPYAALGASDLAAMLRGGGLVADVKAMWRGRDWPEGVRYWTF